MKHPLTIIGTMSGTSYDGLDASIVKTDGKTIYSLGDSASLEYPKHLRGAIGSVIEGNYNTTLLLETRDELTKFHAFLIERLLNNSGVQASQVDLIGFHGQTIYHDPNASLTWQIANPALLAYKTGIDVVADFRSMDMAAGGQGAPLVPLFHSALFSSYQEPIAVVNIGGVANVTYLDHGTKQILAFDTGPGCALINDLMFKKFFKNYDDQGKIAATGSVNKAYLDHLVMHEYFASPPPKSLDRNQFSYAISYLEALADNDALCTLTHLTAKSIADSMQHLPKVPKLWIICGGGRKNLFLMSLLREYGLNAVDVDELEVLGKKLNGSYIEAQAFAFLAARAYYGLPLSLPTTTGIAQEVSGAALYSGKGFCNR